MSEFATVFRGDLLKLVAINGFLGTVIILASTIGNCVHMDLISSIPIAILNTLDEFWIEGTICKEK